MITCSSPRRDIARVAVRLFALGTLILACIVGGIRAQTLVQTIGSELFGVSRDPGSAASSAGSPLDVRGADSYDIIRSVPSFLVTDPCSVVSASHSP
jgi:hypothetical protein